MVSVKRRNPSRIHPTSSEDPRTDPCLITEPVAGNLAFHEYLEWLGTQPFYTKYGFDRRAGMGVVGGSLIGVSTALAHIYDKSGRVVGETMPHEAKALVKFFDETCTKCAPHTQKTVWDAPYCSEITKCGSGGEPTPDHEGEQAFLNAGDAKTGALLPEKELLHAQVSDALAAMVRALQKSDGGHGGGAFFCTDYFGYPGVSKARKHLNGIVDNVEDTVHPDATCTPGTLKKLNELFKYEPAFMMLRKVTQDLKELALVVPYPKETRLEDVATLKAWRQLYPSRVLVLIPISSGFSPTTSCNLLAAITHAQGKEEIARRWPDEPSKDPAATATGTPNATAFGLKTGRYCSEIPRPCILAVASGGYGTLTQMRAVSTAEHSVQLICLQGSGRVADMWADAWPRRGQERFELRTARMRLQRAACKPPQVEHIDCMRQVLSEGELTLHPMSNESSALQRLCENLLTGDKIIRLASSQYAAYKAAQRNYAWPRLVMTNTSIILGFISTVVAVLLPDSNSAAADAQCPEQNATAGPDQGIEIGGTFYQVLYYASIILPALMLVVDQVEAWMGTKRAKEACERAAGLVESHLFRYKVRAQGFADHVLITRYPHLDLATARSTLFSEQLNHIQTEIAKSLAQVKFNHGGAGQDIPLVGRKGTPDADSLNGDEYINVRVVPQIQASTGESRSYFYYSLAGRLALFFASAIGTIISTLGYARYMAISVSVSTSISRWMSNTRVEERLAAHMKAISELTCTKLRWEALPAEKRAQQAEIDKLVGVVESYLEATLPPPPADYEEPEIMKPPPPEDLNKGVERQTEKNAPPDTPAVVEPAPAVDM